MPENQDNSGAKPAESILFADMNKHHVGALLGSLILLLVLVLGGLYLWGAQLAKNENQARVERAIPNKEPETPRAVADKQILNTVSPSSDIEAIYADLDSTNLDVLDTEFDTIMTEMTAALR